MTSIVKESLFRAIAFGIAATVTSYFMGGVRFPYGEVTFPKMWVQLVCNFLIYFVVFFLVHLLFGWVHSKLKKDSK